jgi:ferredoxin/flavodoxin---NADP+ reductase
VHRRREFRGDFKTIEAIPSIKVKTPYIPIAIVKAGPLLQSLVIQHVETGEKEDLKADFLFVNFGHVPSIESFGLEKQGVGIKVNEHFETHLPNVYAIGDVSGYEGKLKRIAPGLSEAHQVIERILNKVNSF